MHYDRRGFLKTSGIALSVLVGGELLVMSPAGAFAAGADYQVFTPDQVTTLEVLAETMVPGARRAGVAHYIDKQLAAGPKDSLLMLKYLGVPVSGHANFYQSALASAAQFSAARFDTTGFALTAAQRADLVQAIAGDAVSQWQGPPASFFFFVLRADACDVVYGTEAGFEKIDMPYLAHIRPPHEW